MKKIIVFAAICVTSFGQTVVKIPDLTVSADATTSINAWMAGQVSGAPAKQTLDVTNVATTITVNSTNGIAGSALIKIDSEIIQVVSKTATVFTVTRGALGTTAASHTAGSAVYELKYKSVSALFMAIIAGQVQVIQELSPAGAVATEIAAITAAKGRIETAKADAVK